ncbi:protein ASPARTIC PROTEASE IN GUARD CELL 1-like [Senna tora]|uniref:Protein ASPARTIC PROTEASE IN GUARD CELL 1-like n=1 Tax=Senna tora TaxID=362788 RepID=A0A834X701_9FABA|nr:protein ASPARTIC PROTEASE IN GUARD CELL 1-like [Senna tora]
MQFSPIAMTINLLLLLLTSSFVLTKSSPPHYSPSLPLLTIPLYNHHHHHPQTELGTENLYPRDNGYAVFLLVGTPAQVLLLQVHTTVHFTWAQCSPCGATCYPQSRPLFDPHASTTLRQLTSDSDTCRIPQMQNVFIFPLGSSSCRYDLKYAGQSRSMGRVVTDTLTLAHSNRVLDGFVMGCGDSHEGPFKARFSGVLGLGRGPLSLPSQLEAEAFSLCFVSPTSTIPSLLSFYKSPPPNYPNGSFVVPLIQNERYPQYYFVQLAGIGIGGFMLDIPATVWGYGLNFVDGGVVVDTAADVMRLPSEAYGVFAAEIRTAMANFTSKVGPEGLEFCYDDEDGGEEGALRVIPEMEIYFENGGNEGERLVTWKLSREQSTLKVGERMVCIAFGEGKNSALTVIGNRLLERTMLTWDLANDVLVFTPNAC